MSAVETDQIPPTALLVGVNLGQAGFDEQLQELSLLARTAGLQPVARLSCKRQAPDAAFFVGKGKAEEIRALAQSENAQEILFDQALSPVQQRNLEALIGLPVNDRTLLILEIFAQRARSHEGKLQVELARLQYLSTRLVRRWTHLERQQGGIGTRGGPGERQIELDRRMIGQAIKRCKSRLEKVKRQRSTQRRQRKRGQVFNISLVGYTNAGKTTLFNALTKAQAYAADKLFATLDTTTRQLYLQAAGQSVSLSDTVGFIHNLPHGLVDAFEATLQEAVDADLLLHVVDCANPAFIEQMRDVGKVLTDIGAAEVPQLLVFSQVDRLDARHQPHRWHDVMEHDGHEIERIFVSAKTGQGMEQLRQRLAEYALGRDQASVLLPGPFDATHTAFGHNGGLTPRQQDS